jgi:putative hemolysin
MPDHSSSAPAHDSAEQQPLTSRMQQTGAGAPRRRRRRLLRFPRRRRRAARRNHEAQKQVPSLLGIVRAGGAMVSPNRFRLRSFRPRVPVHVEIRNFIVKTAQNARELEKILHLRYEVFYTEYADRRRLFWIDLDKFDLVCDHLMIIDKKSGNCIGTYRLNCSLFNDHFYSQTEFEMDAVAELEGVKLEIGRACVHKDFRKGIILALLWRGMSEYMKATDTRYLFGCSSIKTTDPLEIAVLNAYLNGNYPPPDTCRVRPREDHELKQLPVYMRLAEHLGLEVITEHAERLIPALLSSYLRAGAWVCGDPAVDRDFHCVDFFTLLDREMLKKGLDKRYF